MLSGEKLAAFPRVVVELGMGDGRLLEKLAKADAGSLYIGIEISADEFGQAQSRISLENALLLNGSFTDLIRAFPDNSIDMFMAILPDPSFIDRGKRDVWQPFYAQVLLKLKSGGTLQLVTELTDELLQPVSDSSFQEWKEWLVETFTSIGFIVTDLLSDAPAEYSSRCLDQFLGDRLRIRIVTMNLTKT
jgi:tRNA G46 methylase TrmB